METMNIMDRIAAGLRHGAPVVRPHLYVFGAKVTVDDRYGLSCRHGFLVVTAAITRSTIFSGTPVTREFTMHSRWKTSTNTGNVV